MNVFKFKKKKKLLYSNDKNYKYDLKHEKLFRMRVEKQSVRVLQGKKRNCSV